MSSWIVVVLGFFDLFILGYFDVIWCVVVLYDELYVLVVYNFGKEVMLLIV